ncbi:phosphate/phosphite/phosphonate ABC transporter substrate-binding protein [Janthinobacterium sp. 17J80-10]|uniref:phosphate/phosphite/phosphonate ABC transporter substrate-binding protein n=1 Tax=Janthinobacterium sp. 17J80-10 TaxID=2497863 RepID=UPI0010057FA9|nr:phosphate/phosphite/phosphonate ABC transporter substrate-binding protein [Janthinobacterium sp. 17J80-10]QAU33609.1 phosphate/phosphite/phosphonate ABC transporter substrate-binding protein [Janthinobacterium sp. 17J80-10]
MKLPWILAFALVTGLALPMASKAQPTHSSAPLTFGVLKVRSAVATAQYWNPILRHISQKSGVPLKLRLAKSNADHAAMIIRGELDFIYSYYQFAPGNDAAGYLAIVRPVEAPMYSQIIVPATAPHQSLDQLRGHAVAFVSRGAFAGYLAPMDALQRAGITVEPHFAGTLESALGQMVSGRVQAAAVNSLIAQNYAARKKIVYRVLWSSEEYPALPVSVHPAVPQDSVAAVRAAFLQMADDPQGQRILADSAPLFGAQALHGFTAASDNDYGQMRRFHRQRKELRNIP